jgi:hypothetical protein
VYVCAEAFPKVNGTANGQRKDGGVPGAADKFSGSADKGQNQVRILFAGRARKGCFPTWIAPCESDPEYKERTAIDATANSLKSGV